MIKLLFSGAGKLTLSQLSARGSIPLALAYVIHELHHRDGKIGPEAQSAINFLNDGMREQFWQDRIVWSSPVHDNKDELARYFIRRTISALGIVALPESDKILASHHCSRSEDCRFRDVMVLAQNASKEIRILRKKVKGTEASALSLYLR